MLVCSISQLARRAGIAADLAEAATALDAPGTGNVVFATLVDDPASVDEIVDAYLGQIMLEAANASDAFDGSVPGSYAADIAEAATAAETQDGTKLVSMATWDPATVTAVTLSGGNLVTTNTGTTSADQGAKVASASAKSSGKYYFEVTATSISAVTTSNRGVGVGTFASTYTNMGNGGTTGVIAYTGSPIYTNGSSPASNGTINTSGQVMGLAVDFDNRRFWSRLAPSGVWNNSGLNDPATNTGGVSFPSGAMVPFITFGGSGGTASNVMTANFGASAFSGAVPSGFTSGWPS